MNRRRLLVIGTVAAALGSLASWFVYRSLEQRIATSLRAEVDVVVAAQDIRVGERLEDRNLQVVTYRDTFLPGGVLHRRQGAVGRVAVLPIAKGEFVLPYKIGIDGSGDHLTAQIPVGMRAIQVPVNEFESSSIKSGDRVDVLVTGNATGGNDIQTKTVLPNLRLLAIGSRVVTLVVSPQDAEKLTLATQEGHIKLVFRNPGDTTQEDTPAITRTTLYGVTTRPKVRKIAPPPPEAPQYLEIEVIHGSKPPETIKMKQ